METRPYRGRIDYEHLADLFKTLSVASRVELLHQLQLPRASGEVRLRPTRQDKGLNPERSLSRQAVERHLEVLREAGLVRSRHSEREGQPVREYLVNAPRLFALIDEMRRLGVLRPAPGASAGFSGALDATQAGEAPQSRAPLPDGPSLVLATGPMEGAAWALAGEGPWLVGREGAAPIGVPYDPYVSAENAEVWREGGRWFVRDLPQSSNGTTLNWRLLEKGEAAPLVGGDTLGVGRTLLVVRAI